MYYETIIHEKLTVDTLAEVSELLINKKPACYIAINRGNFYFVNDAHIDDPPFSEVAVLFEKDNKYYQFESLSGTALKEEELNNIINEYLDNRYVDRLKHLLFEKNDTVNAWFTCGCCSDRFYSNVSYQLKFNQDNGYGICPRCSKYYE